VVIEVAVPFVLRRSIPWRMRPMRKRRNLRTPFVKRDRVNDCRLRGNLRKPEGIVDVRAAVAHNAGQPLTVETVRLDGPKAG